MPVDLEPYLCYFAMDLIKKIQLIVVRPVCGNYGVGWIRHVFIEIIRQHKKRKAFCLVMCLHYRLS